MTEALFAAHTPIRLALGVAVLLAPILTVVVLCRHNFRVPYAVSSAGTACDGCQRLQYLIQNR